MHKRIVFFLAAGLIYSLPLYSQVTISIGTGLDSNAFVPINANAAYTYSQQIYLQNEINQSGVVNKLRFFVSTSYASNPSNSQAWVVYMGHTAQTFFTSTSDWIPLANLTMVFNGNITWVPGGNGWVELILNNSFTYDNINNLVIAVDENTSGSNSSFIRWGVFSASPSNRVIRYYDAATSTNPNPASPPLGSPTTRASAPDRIQLEVTPLCTAPNINITGNTSICPGDSTILTANAISSNGPITSYQWQLNSSNIVGATSNNYAASSAGNYTVYVIDSSGCPATSSAIVITVDPLPTSSFTDSINANTVTFTNTSQNAISYSWDFGDGSPADTSINPAHTYSASGTYTVTLTVTNGCGSSTSTQQVTVIITGSEIEQNINSLHIFPNPAEQLLTVEFKVADGANAVVKIFNSLGQEVFSHEQKNALVQHRISIDVSSFAEGHYMLQIITDKGTMNKEIVIH